MPLADRVLIEPTPVELKTASGLIIPDSAKEKPLKGKIVAAGAGKPDVAATAKLARTVLARGFRVSTDRRPRRSS